LRFLGMMLVLVLIFGSCGTLTLGAMDKVQTASTAPLLNLGNLLGFIGHFIGELIRIVTTGHDIAGTPYHNYILSGAAVTVEFCFLAMPMAIALGLVLALMSRSPLRIVRAPARTYVEFFRDTPLVVQLLAIYWGLGFLPPQLINLFTAGLATLVLNYAAYECENLRAGIEALDRGQGEAAMALGLSAFQSLRLVVLPQMISIVLPTVINDLIYMYKDSSILSIIGQVYPELTQTAEGLTRRSASNFWQFYLIIGGVYLLLSVPLSRVARAVEARLKSTTFAPRRDPVQLALLVLLGTAAIGWICGVLVEGVSGTTAINTLGQIAAGAGVSLGAMLLVFVTLGMVVYLIGSLFGVFRRGDRPQRPLAESKLERELAPALLPE
jgi:His/Glu/Gln/Arg/opine family amino acid ABC transporter permease subunit